MPNLPEEEKQSGPTPRHVPKERPGPVGGKRDQNRRRRTRELCDAGLLLFLERGTESVTIDDIVSHANVAKGSFYRYFSDKEELVETLFAGLYHDLITTFQRCEEALKKARDLPTMFVAYQEFALELQTIFLENADLALLYLQENRAPATGGRKAIRRLSDAITQGALVLTDAARTHGLLRAFDPRISTLAVIGALERLLFGVMSAEDVGDLEQLAPSLISLVLDGLRVTEPAHTEDG